MVNGTHKSETVTYKLHHFHHNSQLSKVDFSLDFVHLSLDSQIANFGYFSAKYASLFQPQNGHKKRRKMHFSSALFCITQHFTLNWVISHSSIGWMRCCVTDNGTLLEWVEFFDFAEIFFGPNSAFLVLSVEEYFKNSCQAKLDQILLAMSQISICWVY